MKNYFVNLRKDRKTKVMFDIQEACVQTKTFLQKIKNIV